MNDIGLETEKFLEILIRHYLIERKEELKIDPNVLIGCGFDIGKDNGVFFNIICPKLKREGILRQYSELINPEDFIRDSQNPDKYRYPFTFIVNKEKLGGIIKENKLSDSLTKYENGILYFQNKEFDFDKKDNQRDLLNTLFKEPNKNWFYDEIQKDWDENWDGIEKNNPKSQKYWRKFHTASIGINTTIAIETGIKDLIIKNTGTKGKIRINEKYL